jgi:general secretion pathway protein K
MNRASIDEQGVVLIALLWILTALTVIALSFSRESYVEVAAARNARDLSDGYYIARAGFTATVYQLVQRRFTPRVRQLELNAPPDPIDLGHVTGSFGDGVYEIDIQDESGRINLNFAPEEQLHALMDACGIDKRDADVIVDSILDWRDADNLHRLNGAEDDFYQTLNPPYKAKNGRFDTVEELLLVRGVARQYFYGFAEKTPEGEIVQRYGLSRYLTVYSTGNRINVNYAPLQVLLSIPGMPPQLAISIIEKRKTKPLVSLEEISRELPANIGATALPYLSTDQTGVYTLTVRGRRETSRVNRLIRAVVSLDPREPTKYRILYWNENVPIV